MNKSTMSWPDRFAVIDHFKPTDEQVRQAFGLTQDELETARTLRAAGMFASTASLDASKYASIFDASQQTSVTPSTTTTIKPQRPSTTTTHTKPETATKRVKVPQKRGRKGDKIARALAAVPTVQTPVTTFMQEYGVSLAVLRQSKRFVEKLTAEQQRAIGKINVRQDKASKQLMIWREEA